MFLCIHVKDSSVLKFISSVLQGLLRVHIRLNNRVISGYIRCSPRGVWLSLQVLTPLTVSIAWIIFFSSVKMKHTSPCTYLISHFFSMEKTAFLSGFLPQTKSSSDLKTGLFKWSQSLYDIPSSHYKAKGCNHFPPLHFVGYHFAQTSVSGRGCVVVR